MKNICPCCFSNGGFNLSNEPRFLRDTVTAFREEAHTLRICWTRKLYMAWQERHVAFTMHVFVALRKLGYNWEFCGILFVTMFKDPFSRDSQNVHEKRFNSLLLSHLCWPFTVRKVHEKAFQFIVTYILPFYGSTSICFLQIISIEEERPRRCVEGASVTRLFFDDSCTAWLLSFRGFLFSATLFFSTILLIYISHTASSHWLLFADSPFIMKLLLILSLFSVCLHRSNCQTAGVCTVPIDGVVTCCPLGCGLCGGSGCEDFPLGPENCCRNRILANNRFCFRNQVPCAIQVEGICTPVLASGKKVCCPDSCRECGGTGCETRPGGAQNCCVGPIEASGKSCTNNPPPCVAWEVLSLFNILGCTGCMYYPRIIKC